MSIPEQKTAVRCAIQSVLRAGVRDEQNDRIRAMREIARNINRAGVPVFSTNVLSLPNYNGYGPMLYGETMVIMDGEPQHFELMVKAN